LSASAPSSQDLSLAAFTINIAESSFRHTQVDQIANDIGMSRQNVEHYMRFKDQMKVGADGQKRLRLVTMED
jgi:hypothetical protein